MFRRKWDSSISTPWLLAGLARIGIRALLEYTGSSANPASYSTGTRNSFPWLKLPGDQANLQTTLRDQPTALQNTFSEKRNIRTKICDTFTMHAMFTATCDALYFAKDNRVYKVSCLPNKRLFTAPRAKLQGPGDLGDHRRRRVEEDTRLSYIVKNCRHHFFYARWSKIWKAQYCVCFRNCMVSFSCPFLTVDKDCILEITMWHEIFVSSIMQTESWDYNYRRILRSKECTLYVKVMSVRLWSTVSEAKPSGAFLWYSTRLNKRCAIPIIVKIATKKTQRLRLRPTCVSAPISSIKMFPGAKNIASNSCSEKEIHFRLNELFGPC